MEAEIAIAEGEIERIETLFSAPDFYEKYGSQTIQLTDELESAKRKVDGLYARWHELEELKKGL